MDLFADAPADAAAQEAPEPARRLVWVPGEALTAP